MGRLKAKKVKRTYKKKSDYYKMPLWLLMDPGFTMEEKLVMIVIDHICKNSIDGVCDETDKQIGERVGMSEQEVADITESLDKKGIAKIEYRDVECWCVNEEKMDEYKEMYKKNK